MCRVMFRNSVDICKDAFLWRGLLTEAPTSERMNDKLYYIIANGDPS